MDALLGLMLIIALLSTFHRQAAVEATQADLYERLYENYED